MKRIGFQTLALLLALAACNKDVTKIYEVNRQQVSLNTIDKEALKADLEFIANVHNDLFGTPIDGGMLQQTLVDLASSNDKKLVTDLVVRQMLNRADLPAPTDAAMRADLDGFVLKTYKRFFHREPNPFEAFKIRQMIEGDSAMSPVMVWYAFLTSEEYRFF